MYNLYKTHEPIKHIVKTVTLSRRTYAKSMGTYITYINVYQDVDNMHANKHSTYTDLHRTHRHPHESYEDPFHSRKHPDTPINP